MDFKYIEKRDYILNKEKYLHLIKEMFKGDKNKLANENEIENHLDFIFSNQFTNNAFLILQIKNNKLISMINFFEYNNCLNEWCLFSLFTNRNFRNRGYGEKTMLFALSKLKKYKCTKLISGIESENIPSIKLHEKVGFKYANCNWDELAPGFPENHLGYIYNFED